MYAPMLLAYILTTRILSVWLIIARCNEFAPCSTDFIVIKKDGRVVMNGCVQRNNTTGGIGTGKGFPHSLVAVGGSGVRAPMYLGQRIWNAE